jgi:TRAP-type C4-dicarboxylate transport system permease small subunit
MQSRTTHFLCGVALDVLRHVLIGGFFFLFVKYGLQIYQIKWKKPLPATGWSQGIVFAAQVIVCVLIVFFCIMNVMKTVILRESKGQKEQREKEAAAEKEASA